MQCTHNDRTCATFSEKKRKHTEECWKINPILKPVGPKGKEKMSGEEEKRSR